MEACEVQEESCSTMDDAQSSADAANPDDSTYKETQNEVERCMFNMLGVEEGAQNVVYVKLEEATAAGLNAKNCELQVTGSDLGSQNVIFVNMEDVCPDSVLALMEGGGKEGEQALVIDNSINHVPGQGERTLVIDSSGVVSEQAFVVGGDISNVLQSAIEASNIRASMQPTEAEERTASTQVVDSVRDKETEAAIQHIIFSNGMPQGTGQIAMESGAPCPWVIEESDLVGDQEAYSVFKKTGKGSKKKKVKKGLLMQHSTTNSGQKKYKCEICNKSFLRRQKFVKHMERLHRSSEIPCSAFLCSICNNSFANKSTYSRHWESHFNTINTKKKTTMKRSHICGKCGKAFLKRTHLREHEMCAHQGFRRNWCSLCVKGFTRPSKLKRHMLTVHNILESNPEYSRVVNTMSGKNGGRGPITQGQMDTGDVKSGDVSIDHVSNDLDGKMHCCRFCDRSFPRPSRLKKHMEKKHPMPSESPKESPNITCPVCNKTFADNGTYSRHWAAHFDEANKNDDTAPKKNHICGSCGKGFLKKSYLSEHYLSAHSGQKRNWCNFCQRGFTRPSKLQRHLDKIHQISEGTKQRQIEQYQTGIGESSGVMEKMLPSPVTVMLDSSYVVNSEVQTTPLECDANKVSKAAKGEGKRVKKSKGKGSTRTYYCSICMEMFSSLKKFKRHYASHHDNAMPVLPGILLDCSKCDKTFKKKKRLKEHMALHIAQNNLKKNTCYICHKGFSRPVRLRKHMASQHDITEFPRSDYECLICKYTFANKIEFAMHMASHADEVDEGSPRSQDLAEGSHICVTCGEGFREKAHLVEHMSVHTGDLKKNWCQMCDKSFARPSKLKRHIASVHHIHVTELTATQSALLEKDSPSYLESPFF